MLVSKLAPLMTPAGWAADSALAGSTVTPTVASGGGGVARPPNVSPRDAYARTCTSPWVEGVQEPVQRPLAVGVEVKVANNAFGLVDAFTNSAVGLSEGRSGLPQSSDICTWNVCDCPTWSSAFSPGLLNVATRVFGVQLVAESERATAVDLSRASAAAPGVATPEVANNATWMVCIVPSPKATWTVP